MAGDLVMNLLMLQRSKKFVKEAPLMELKELKELNTKLVDLILGYEERTRQHVETGILDNVLKATAAELEFRRRMQALDCMLAELRAHLKK